MRLLIIVPVALSTLLASLPPAYGQEPAKAPAAGNEATTPVARQPNASTPPPPPERDPEGKWFSVVPVMLWWAGPKKPRFKVCTDNDLGEGVGKGCEVLGAPENVRSIQMQCEWNCSELEPRKRVEVHGKVVGQFLVATEAREPQPPPAESTPAKEEEKKDPPKS